MPLSKKALFTQVLLLTALCLLLWYFYPNLLAQVMRWQRLFNQSISENLHLVRQAPAYAGGYLVLVSFLYGVFHAVGPGHGKFIIASYLSANSMQIKKGIRLTLVASLVQGLVAILMTSIVVVVLTLSSRYFKLTQVWMERASFAIMVLIGLYWLVMSGKKWLSAVRAKPAAAIKAVKIKRINATAPIPQASNIGLKKPLSHSDDGCGCGHKHAPNAQELAAASDWKSQLMIILSIGMRPCSGAIFVLFLAYMLDLYPWGMLATMAMAIGTGLSLSGFACLVLFARSHAVKLGRWYLSPQLSQHIGLWVKMAFGLLLIALGIALIHGTTLPASGGAALFSR
ncbi:zinc transporter permease subunit ZevB [Pasteurellaceae bacterium 20609_3]|uniref:zinc transporter permease subunit ZevB n=1 Tax=Spirabiliibacterium mucosae TaxID=28156 RepID=UPI001AADF10C|nr:zinc transporter permease subunit ZevB [Spirabiliibacterium mucosae]MBE2898722.1 zinc transporter permease subunit ZevB [Spirabiliibacterium mucosae]